MVAPTGAELERVEESGIAVWVDEEAGTVYVEDCEDARRLTGQGGRWVGYASISSTCDDDRETVVATTATSTTQLPAPSQTSGNRVACERLKESENRPSARSDDEVAAQLAEFRDIAGDAEGSFRNELLSLADAIERGDFEHFGDRINSIANTCSAEGVELQRA